MIERSYTRDFIARWDAFWHIEGSPFTLGIFRALLAFCLWQEVATSRQRSVFAIVGGGYHLPYADFIQLVSQAAYNTIHELQYPLIVLFAIGWHTRFSCLALLLLQGYVFFADQLNFRNHPYFFLLILFLLLLSPAGEALSVQRLLQARKMGQPVLAALLGPIRPLTMQRLIQVQLCLVYMFAGLHKLRPAFLDGSVLHGLLVRDLPSRTSGELLSRFITEADLIVLFHADWFFSALAWVTALTELSLPIALWSRRTRWLAICAGTLFHLSIALIMEIHVFSYAVIASYLLFLDSETLPRALRRLWRRRAPSDTAAAELGMHGDLARTT